MIFKLLDLVVPGKRVCMQVVQCVVSQTSWWGGTHSQVPELLYCPLLLPWDLLSSPMLRKGLHCTTAAASVHLGDTSVHPLLLFVPRASFVVPGALERRSSFSFLFGSLAMQNPSKCSWQ